MKKPPLHWQVIIGLILGAIYAYCSIVFGWNEFTIYYIKPIGDIFIKALKLIAVPLVLFSIIVGVASLKDIKKLGKMGLKTLLLYLTTTMIAVTVGLVLVNLIKPGEKQDQEVRERNRLSYETWRDDNGIQRMDALALDLSTKPEYAEKLAEIKATKGKEELSDWVKDKLSKAENEKRAAKEVGPLKPVVDVVPTNIFQALADTQMLQVIFFAIFFGIVLVQIPEEHAKPVFNLVNGLNEVFVKMIWFVMDAMPVFVFALMAGQIVKAAGTDPDKFFELLDFLWRYSLVVVVGLFIMIFLFYPTITSILVKKINYKYFMSAMRDAQVTAFSTSSSVATLPVTMDCVNRKMGVSERTTSFVLPIGATVNMDGTSLYQAVAVISLAQFHMVDLTLSQQLVIILTATLASIGAAAIPSAGLVLMIIVLESVGLNPAWIALIFPVDRILDMCRTVVNVTGDGAVSTLIASSENELVIQEKEKVEVT
ncbi:MAG: dicarboxylate/amino acid:cation symporter [Bacteroidia bacterium]|nr:dicarboxylate/amino acid:cation symporter [Bacteroidia bacterium]NNC85415.1 dicarboxylate/amino acid:cation symporter [Bacteroidia bacterium]NNM16133.1 dicarboxylate/amino acid:cation symporter [Bacteroidia bacterium]